MSKLMDEIRDAQVHAGEQVVTNHLTDIGLMPLADDSAKYKLWDRSTLEFFTRVTEMQNRILKKILAKHEEHGKALAMDLQFDIDVASSLVHSADALDAARWRVMMICADDPDSPEGLALNQTSVANGPERTHDINAAEMITMADEVIAAMKADDEN